MTTASPSPLKQKHTPKRQSFAAKAVLAGVLVFCVSYFVCMSESSSETLFKYFRKINPFERREEAPVEGQITVHSITTHYLEALRKLNTVLLPVYYSDRLYRDVLENQAVCKIAMLKKNVPVGAITSRVDDKAENPEGMTDFGMSKCSRVFAEKHLYIMTLGVIAPYRRLGIGSKLLNGLMDEINLSNERAIKEYHAGSNSIDFSDGANYYNTWPIITALTLHVQYNNTAGMKFYESNGFKVARDVPNYYTRIEPRGAYFMMREVSVQLDCAPKDDL